MISYQDAKLDDLPFIVDIYNSTIASRNVTADLNAVSLESKLEWFYAHNPQTRPLWLIKFANHPCGWVSLSSFYGRPAYQNTVEISLYIHRDYRGKKIGSFMINAIEAFAKSIGINTILSFIFAQNIPSINLFTKQNYQQYGFLPKVAELDDNYCDLVILGKRLKD